MPEPTAMFKYRKGQLLWHHHKIYGWERGKVEAKYDFEGVPHYRVIIVHGDKTRMFVTAKEQYFHKERGA
jgi:hypothetical protein